MTQDLSPLKAAASSGLAPLTLYPQWVAWKATPPTDDNPRWSKMLINPHTGEAADSTDPNTQSDYQTALQFAELMGYGVGFVFSHTDPFFFVDIDGCYEPTTGWSDRANELCGRLQGAFIEVSVSGTGLHIIGMGERPDGYRIKAADKSFDIYTTGRFCALTGTHAHGSADADHGATISGLLQQYMNPMLSADPEQWSTGPVPEWSGYSDDGELIEAAYRSKSAAGVFAGRATFRDLWDANEDALAATYPHETRDDTYDASAADAALCQHLAFWTGKDCERMDRLFRQSALMRDKWDKRKDYRQDTILGAVAGCQNVYQTARVPEQQTTAAVGHSVPAPNTQRPRYLDIEAGQGVYSDGKDTENAATFLQCWYPNDALKFVQEQAFRFNGRVWEHVEDSALKHELVVAMWSSCPKDATINSTFSLIKKRCTAPTVPLGSWPGRDVRHLVVCQNGILDVHTGEIEPHNSEFFTTGILPYSYDPGAQCIEWQRFLWGTLEGDQERIDLLQEWMGYQLVTDYTHHKAMLLVGAPRSGKGTIGSVLHQLVGDTAYQGITLDGISSDAVMESVIDKTVLFIGDAHDVNGGERNRILDRFLSITGGDQLTITRKYIKSWSGVIPGRLTIAANSIPTFFDDSGAFGNRLLILPFNKSFLGREDLTLKDRLMKELPGICNWAIEGLRRLRSRGYFTEPEISRQERDEMMRQQAPLIGFIDDECEFEQGAVAFAKDLYNRYVQWCLASGVRSATQPKFTRNLKATLRSRGVTKQPVYKDGATLQGFRGVRLRPVKIEGVPSA